MRKYKAIGCIADNTAKAKEAYVLLCKKYDLIDVRMQTKNLDLIIVLGGDGFMLHNLHRFMSLNIPIFGMNCGTIGFLMNDFSIDNLIKRLNEARCTFIHPLKMIATSRDGSISKALAINEVYLFRQTNQVAKIKITVDERVRIKEMVGDGVLIATSAGSSAYNFSAGGPIIPLGSNILSLTPISPFRPRRWRGALLPHMVTVKLDIIESEKRPVSAVADFNEIRDIISVEIKEARNKKIRLLFDMDHSLEDRIIREQFAY